MSACGILIGILLVFVGLPRLIKFIKFCDYYVDQKLAERERKRIVEKVKRMDQ